MSCSAVDLKAYILGEVNGQERVAGEAHVHTCEYCREELARLQLTQTALLSLDEAEPPRRIAFVSDAVFEPRWWQRIWRSGPALGFASALVLAIAILVNAFSRPAPVYVTQQAPPVTMTSTDVDRKVRDAVLQAVAHIEERQNVAEKRTEARHRAELLAAQDTIRLYQQQMGRMLVAYNDQSRSGQ